MQKVIKPLENWLLLINKFKSNKCIFVLVTIFNIFYSKAQIANYIQNGGLEQYYSCTGFNSINLIKHWRTIDSSLFAGVLFNNACYGNVPSSGFGYQFARTGNGYCLTDFLCQPPQCSSTSNRGYFRNRLKSNLIAGKTYCVKFYVNIGNNSTYGIDAFGAYFGDNSLDTITKISIPLTYLNPQVQNANGNIITDTLNWILITGTFVANGTEKHCLIGNFKSDVNTNKVLINPANLPIIGSTVLIDDVSCIPTDLPAYAGADIWAIPSTTVYIGRPQDVGIDEACTWYNMTNTNTPIATAAGITLTVAPTTQTYMVKQDICGVIKYDTVVVNTSGLGNVELEMLNDKLRVFPNPANDVIQIEIDMTELINDYKSIVIYNSLGQLLREEELSFEKNHAKVNISDLSNGVYLMRISTYKGFSIQRALVIRK